MGVLRMWLVGVVVRRYIDILIILLIPTPLVLAFLGSSIPVYVVTYTTIQHLKQKIVKLH